MILARAYEGAARARWLGLAAISIGAVGIWAMHFIAMLGYTVPGEPLLYNVPLTIASMLLAVVVVIISVLIAIVAGTAALWIGTWVRGVGATIGAALIFGVAVTGMHYTGMAALHVTGTTQSMAAAALSVSGATAASFLIPLLVVISLATFLLTLAISMTPSEEEIIADRDMRRRLEQLERRNAAQETSPRQYDPPGLPVQRPW